MSKEDLQPHVKIIVCQMLLLLSSRVIFSNRVVCLEPESNRAVYLLKVYRRNFVSHGGRTVAIFLQRRRFLHVQVGQTEICESRKIF